MNKIIAHSPTTDFSAAYGYAIKKRLDMAQLPAVALSGWLHRGLDLGRLGIALHQPAGAILYGIAMAADAGAAMFESAIQGNTQAMITGRSIAIQGAPDESSLNAGMWLTAFWLSATLRNARNLDILSRTPLELLHKSSSKSPLFQYRLVQCLQSFWLRKPDAGKLLMSAMEATDPKQFDLFVPARVLALDARHIAVFGLALAGDSDFEEALAEAITSHKRYYSSSPQQRDEWSGYFAHELSAIASIAFDRGIKPAVESNYLPAWLVRKEFLEWNVPS